MRTADDVSLYLGFLLAFIVTVKCESQHERRLLYRTETVTLSELRTKTHSAGNHSHDGGARIPGICYVCREIVKALRNYIKAQFKQKSYTLCGKFVPKLRKKCRNKAKNLETKLMSKLFSQNERAIYETETGTLIKSFSVKRAHGKNNHTEDSRFIKCLICRIAVNSVRRRINARIQKKIHEVCRSFVKNLRPKCYDFCYELRPKLLKEIFPGGNWGTCNIMGIC
ncbi:hypothetical protein PHYPO_G00012390 [Pangasianodon hypophthalmus]|uniref:Saposin B-type domain-containing protein n=1 Tax=Pangasianodon hypophthalmus TaxID=310915 RepID=A0A5N5N428_PANHP|nr:hypothetical protein PHYPO_G00012390 [Pangasianodon hypophthalmus]